jgi:hypothetical protein
MGRWVATRAAFSNLKVALLNAEILRSLLFTKQSLDKLRGDASNALRLEKARGRIELLS